MNRRIIAFALLFLALSGIADASAYTNVTACMLTLNTTGETYNLINGINQVYPEECFSIDAENITLDCQGNGILVAGSPGSRPTIVVNKNNARVLNCVSSQPYANGYDLIINGNGTYISNFTGQSIVEVSANTVNTTITDITVVGVLYVDPGTSNTTITNGYFNVGTDYSIIYGTNHTFDNVTFFAVDAYDLIGATFNNGGVIATFDPHVSNTIYCPMNVTNFTGSSGFPMAYLGDENASVSYTDIDGLYFCGHSSTMSYGNNVHHRLDATLADGINLQQTNYSGTSISLQMNSSDIRGFTQTGGTASISLDGTFNTISDVVITECSGNNLITDLGTNNIYDNVTTGANCPTFVVGAYGTVKNSIFVNDVWPTVLNLNGSDTIYNNYFKSDDPYFVFNGANTMNTAKQPGTRIYGSGNQIGGNYYTTLCSIGYSDTCTDADLDLFCDDSLVFDAENIDYLPYSRSCITITASGTYTLTTDILADRDYCIDIQSSDVILDCAMHSVNANGFIKPINTGMPSGEGETSYNNVTIKNCKVYAPTEPIFVNGDNNAVFNNLISASDHVYITAVGTTVFNTTRQPGARVFSPGTEIGGNYYTDTGSIGYSDTCADANTDGFCDNPFAFLDPVYEEDTYNCIGTPVDCDIRIQTTCEKSQGCSWNGSECSGTCTPCDTLNSSVCNDQLPCGWINCEGYTTQENCEMNDCVWGDGACSGSSCVGTCVDCSSVAIRCEAYSTGCLWSGSACEGTPNDCSVHDDPFYCGYNFNCNASTTPGALITAGIYDYLPLSNKANVFTMRGYDESTGARIYFTATIVNSTSTTNTGYQYLYQASSTSITNGQVSIVVSNTTYYQSKYIGTIPAGGNSNLDAYLQPLSNLNVKQVSFLTTSASSQALPGVLVSINRLVNGNLVSVGQAYTDSTGMASFFMDSTVSYTVTASMLGYSTVTQTIMPTQTTYTITMGNWTIGMFHQTFYDIQWTFAPTGILDENKTHNLTFSTFSSTGKIVWFAWKIYNDTTLLRFENNTNTMGGTVNYLVLPGPNSNITVYFYIMRANMSEQQLAIWWMPLPVQSFINQIIGDINKYIASNQTLTSVLKNLGNQANNWRAFPNAISSFTLVLGTLIVGVITSAWVGRFSPTGGQLVFVIVMAVGTYMGAGLLASVSLLIFIIFVAVAYQLWRSGG